ncbi:MAG: 50S ribosomal protein L10 [Patescibacteria group bacterium]
MAITKNKKKEIVAKVIDALKDATSAVFVNFHKMPVSETTAMRKALRVQGVGYTVAKKTLLKRALSEKKISGEIPELAGEIAVAYGTGEDMTLPAREVYVFQKKSDGRVAIVGGIFEAAYKTQIEMTEIASIPSREILLAKFVNVINSPIQRLAVALNQIAERKAI